jgi:hypothetical protein
MARSTAGTAHAACAHCQARAVAIAQLARIAMVDRRRSVVQKLAVRRDIGDLPG